ncbi:MAG: hypothetical protein ACRECA_05765 [Pseudolabrys sp.]
MRFLMIAAAATFLMLPATAPAKACGTAVHSTSAVSADYSAKKHKKHKSKEKVEYMRAAPMK